MSSELTVPVGDTTNNMLSSEDNEPVEMNPLFLNADDQRTPLISISQEEVVPYNPWSSQLVRLQLFANLLSHVLAMVSLVLATIWVQKMGGLSWSKNYRKQIFNYHPLFMILAFAFMTVATLKYRVSRCRADRADKRIQKMLHAISNTLALVLGMVAIIAVFRSHNDSTSWSGGNFYANLASLHSWIGMGIVILYLCQFLVASVTFGGMNIPWITDTHRAGIKRLHNFFGRFIYVAVASNIFLGIQEKETFSFKGCSYTVHHADTNPAEHVHRLSYACKISHSLGIIVLVMALTTMFAIYEFDSTSNVEGSTGTRVSPVTELDENVANDQEV